MFVEANEDSDFPISDASFDGRSHGIDMIEDEAVDSTDESGQSTVESVQATHEASGRSSSDSNNGSDKDICESNSSEGQYSRPSLFTLAAHFSRFFR
jgi:hypothetical protein